MTNRLDEHLSARFQACCLNYNDAIKAIFGDEHGIDKHLAFSLQFSSITTEQLSTLRDADGLPANIEAFINAFDSELSEAEFNDPRFSYRVLFIPKTVNHKGQADKVIEFIKANSDLARDINKQYAVIKETEKTKYLPKQVVQKMKDEGYPKFRLHDHTLLWKSLDAKNSSKGLGAEVADGAWYWYDSWIDVVRGHCINNASRYQ